MKTRLLTSVLLGLLMPMATMAQTTDLVGIRLPDGSSSSTVSTARYAVEMTLNGNSTTTAKNTDTVSIMGTVKPESAHIGQQGDLFVVDFVNQQWTMRNDDGAYWPWSFRVPELVAYKKNVTLTAAMSVEVYAGALGAAGNHRIFLGYRPQGGTLFYTAAGQLLTISEVSATEQAAAKFSSSISSNIVNVCVACHVKGGAAELGGATHIFKTPIASSVDANFTIFRNLVALRGPDYILTKVTGGNAHGGGVQLTASSVDYKDLESFLRLLAKDLPPPTNPNPPPPTTMPTEMNNPYDYGY
jgi:hypothetical protein